MQIAKFKMKRNILLVLLFVMVCGASGAADVKYLRLDNGMTVILKEDHKIPALAIQLWVRCGSKDEEETMGGISHFLEHMAFKGTEKYAVNEIHREVEKRGGDINAGTSRDFTYYYIILPGSLLSYMGETQAQGREKAGNSSLRTGLDIIYQVSMKSVFADEEIEKEKLVVLEEIKRKYDDPQGYLWDLFNQAVYAGSPYAHPVLGTEVSVGNFTSGNVADYFREHYTPRNFILVLAGDFKTGEAAGIIRELFGKEKGGPVFPAAHVSLPRQRENPEEVKAERNMMQTYLITGMLGPAGADQDAYAMDVLVYILGKGRASRLHRILRERRELVWDIDCSFITQAGMGPFYVYVECDPQKIPEAREEIKNQLDRFSVEQVTEEEIRRSKALIESEYLLGTESNQGFAFNLGYYELIGSYRWGLDYLKNIMKVTSGDILRVARKYIATERSLCVMVVPSSAQ